MSISVIIPVFNGEKFIAQAIDSVLAQTSPADEVIVIDDGSTDHTAKIIMSYSSAIKYVYQENSGVSKARNHGIKLAQGKYIAFLDHDDIYLPNKLEDAIREFDINPNVNVIAGKWKYLIDKSFLNQTQLDQTIERVGILLGSYLFKRDVFEAIGLFDESLNYAEDVDLIMRINNAKMTILKIDALCLLYRYHETNSTKLINFEEDNKRCTLDVLYKSILERREIKE